MKYAVYITFLFAISLFGIGAYYYFIDFDETLHDRFMGFGTLALIFIFIPTFLLWGHFKREKLKTKITKDNH